MSHRTSGSRGIGLPRALQEELGLQDSKSRGRKAAATRRDAVFDGKGQRRAEGGIPQKVKTRREVQTGQNVAHIKVAKNSKILISRSNSLKSQDAPKTLLKPLVAQRSGLRRGHADSSSQGSSAFDSDRSPSPGIVLDASSKAFRDRSAQDDAEIASLEKKLGLKRKKTLSMGDDALDYLLNDIDDGGGADRRSRIDGQAWLQSKRMRYELDRDSGQVKEGSLSSEDRDILDELGGESNAESGDLDLQNSSSLNNDDSESDILESNGSDEGSEHDIFSESNDGGNNANTKLKAISVRENPYVAPIKPGINVPKYLPPSLRNHNVSDEQSLTRLKRQVQGQVNRLSEANVISILVEIEGLYRTNSRQDVTNVLIDILLSLFCNRSALQNTFIILHAAFIAAVYKVIGIDFGAEMLVRLTEQFDKQYAELEVGKQSLNLISLLANLFTFSVTSSSIVYDYVRMMLSNFNEANAELLLRVVRDCGPQLRADNPAALKGIVSMIQTMLSNIANSGQQLNVRTKVMIDTIMELKNNKMKNATNAAGVTGEHITRMRKALGTLNNRNLKATEPLRLTKQDIENSDRKGKWWLIGASWKGTDGQDAPTPRAVAAAIRDQEQASDEEVDYLALAKQFKMNTDIRRSIFVATMSADDIRDARMRLLKLRLTNKQEQEVAKVLIRCSRAEPLYNPYYALLAKSLCKENKRIRMGFQYGLWDFFKNLGENPDNEDSDDDGDESQNVEMSEVVNLAKLYAYLIFHGQFSLGILKTLNIGMLKEQATLFIEVLLISIMTQPKANEDVLMRVFGRTAETPHLVKSLRYFMKKHIQHSDLVSQVDKGKVKEGCKIAYVVFSTITSSNMGKSFE